jgi:hypothetical protein
METLNRWLASHAQHLRLGWLVLALLLVACNNSDGGGNGY